MKLQLVAAAQGTAWVRKGFQVFARQPLGFASLFAACLFVFLLLGVIPFVGTIALLVLPPTGSLLFMIASRRVVGGETPMPGTLVEFAGAGKARLVALLKLGFAYAAATVLAFWVAGVLDGGAFESFMEALADDKRTAQSVAVHVADGRLQLGLMLRLLFAGALSIPFWHAPALVYWGAQGWAKSLFFSSVALWRNKGAFTVYGLVWMGLWLTLLAIFSVAAVVIGPDRVKLLALPLSLVFLTVFYASVWFTFADCFAPSDVAAPSPRADLDPPDSATKGSS